MIIRQQNVASYTKVVDIPSSFDERWPSYDVATAIAEIASEAIDILYKCRIYNQRSIIKECKENRLLSTIKHLEQVIELEPG